MSVQLEFQNTPLSNLTVFNQVISAVEFYSSQDSTIDSILLSNFPQYAYKKIVPSAIESSIQISTTEFITYYVKMSSILVLKSSSSSSVDKNTVFNSLTTMVNLLNLNFRLKIK